MKKLSCFNEEEKSRLASLPADPRFRLGAVHRRVSALGCLAGLLLGLFIGGNAPCQQRPPEICAPTNCLPPANRKYKSGNQQTAEAHQRWGSKIASRISHKDFTGWDAPPPPVPGSSKLHIFGSTVHGLFSFDNGATFVEASMPAAVRVRTTFDHMEADKEVLIGQIEALDITNPSPPLLIRQSPTIPSKGETTVRPVPGGYAISSFFDVWTELSLDGGASWIPSSVAGRMELTEGDGPPVSASTDTAPPPDSAYCQPPASWPTMFGPNIKARNFKHRQLPSTTIPPSLGQNATYSASGTVIELDASIDGGQTFNHLRAPADVTVAMHHTVDAGPARFFDTEILALDIRGGDLPPQVMLRESPTLASTGEHIIRPAPRGVGFSINSYFDVALELSTDGGQTWTPASGPVHLDVAGPPLLAIPTLSEWGLIILALLLLTVIALFLRRPREMAMAEAGGPRC